MAQGEAHCVLDHRSTVARADRVRRTVPPWTGTRSSHSPPRPGALFADLAERHNGVWGGCWCTWFHPDCEEHGETAEGNRAYKERLVREGHAHAALVFHGGHRDRLGRVRHAGELPGIHHLKQYTATLDRLPDYRITCLFVDKHHRRDGVAELAVRERSA